MRPLKQLVLATFIFAANVASATPLLIANGDFSGGTSGWTLGGSCATPSYTSAGNGSGAVVLNDCGYASSDPTVSQVVSGLVVGHTYLLSWDQQLDSNYSGAGYGKSFGVFLGADGGTPLYTNEYLSSIWKTMSTSFVATSAIQQITFAAELDTRTVGVRLTTDVSYRLDNVTLVDTTPAAVPEPASLALFGLGLAGLALRRRQRG